MTVAAGEVPKVLFFTDVEYDASQPSFLLIFDHFQNLVALFGAARVISMVVIEQ